MSHRVNAADGENRPPTTRISRRLLIISLVVLTIGGIAVAVVVSPRLRHSSPEPQSNKRPVPQSAAYRPPSTEDYVGSPACASCHPQIAESFQTHPMAHSIERVPRTADGAPELTDARIAGDRNAFEVDYVNGRLIHRDCVLNASGETIAEQAVAMDYVVGSGRRAKAYLFQQDNLLFMSPLNWYAGAHRWDMAPGYSIDDPRRFERRVTDECLSCHAGRVAAVGRALDRFESPAFHELAVGCENCHGPGRQHIDFYSVATQRLGGARDPIVNPVKLEPEQREAVCNQCHLQAAVRLKRPGRSDFDFRPGDRFEEIWAVLDTGADVDSQGRTQSVNHVQQMRGSVCFQQSAGKLGCISCHDPHGLPAPEERIDFYRQKCFTCHTDDACTAHDDLRAAQNDSCIACHMPRRDSKNISHVTQTDHRVVKFASPETVISESSELKSLSFFNREQSLLPSWEQDRALGIAAWIYLINADRLPTIANARALIPVLDHAPNDALTLLALGSIAQLNGKRELALTYFKSARSVPAAEEEALINLLELEYEVGNWQEAHAAAERLAKLNPWRAKTFALQADCLFHLDRTTEAIRAAERSLELNPMLLPVREWLAVRYRETGELQKQHEQETLVEQMRRAQAVSSP